MRLGGEEEGRRAIGYIAQTFLADAFPDDARLPVLRDIKAYTLDKVGTGFVWRHSSSLPYPPPNRFPFGHRVIEALTMKMAQPDPTHLFLLHPEFRHPTWGPSAKTSCKGCSPP